MEVRFHPEAERELLAEAMYYEERSPGLGDRLIREVEAAVALASSFPEIGASHRYGTRRVFLRRFPCSIVYRVVGGGIVVFAVAPFRRQQAYWRDRRHDE